MVEGGSGRAGIRVWLICLKLPLGRSERQHLEAKRETGEGRKSTSDSEEERTREKKEGKESMRTHLHDRLAAPLAEDDALVVLERDPPDDLARLGQLADERARAEVPELDSTVVA